MTKNTQHDLLGSPLPGPIWLPHWRVKIETRGQSDALVWNVAYRPQPPTPIAQAHSFVSVPRPARETVFKHRRPHSEDLFRGKSSDNLGALLAAFRALGGQVQHLRQIPPGDPPWFGGYGVLDDFIRLADLPREAILAFAAHWGPLGICSHRLPWTHSLAERSPISTEPMCLPLGVANSKGRSGWEQIDLWREYSREAKAVALDAIALRNRRARNRNDLAHLYGRAGVWIKLAAVPLVTIGDVDPTKPWPCGFGATFTITGVFQILALQLLGVVAGGRALARCSHCGLPFVLTGHREGTRRFCPSCVAKKIPGRYASRDYRSRP